jgi:hypothetical protein
MSITKREWVLLFLVSTLLLAWTSIPLWRGYALQDKRLSFTGTFFDTRDYAVHIAMLRAGAQGEWAYSFRFTTEPHQAQYIRMFYILLGQIDRWLHLDPELLFQLARWVCGYAALFALFGLMKRAFDSARRQWLGFFLAVLGSGLGYAQMMFGWVPGPISPVDLWLIDAYMLFSLALFPHFAFTLALMCVSLSLYLDYLRTGGAKTLWIMILAALLVQLVNPIAFVLVDFAMAGMTLGTWWRDRKINWSHGLTLGMLALTQLPLLAYNFILLNSDPFWSQFTAQNETLSPAPIYYLWGYGLLWPLAALGVWRTWRERNPVLSGALAWTLAAFLLAYAPFAIQRRFLLGITIPLALLAVSGLDVLAARVSRMGAWAERRIPALTLLLALLISMTSIIFSPAYALYMQQQPEEYFYPRALDGAFDWIERNTDPNDFILGAEDTGRLAAQETGRRVYLGHVMETLHYEDKLEEVAAFYRGELPAGWLSRYPIRWVIYGPYERKIAPVFQPGANLELIYEKNEVSIYRVE